MQGSAALRRVRVRPIPALAALVAIAGLLALLAAETASAVELRDSELVAAGEPVLQNGSGTVRLEDSRLGRLGPPVFFVPEPGALWQLGSGVGLLALLAGRRRRRTAYDTPGGEPGCADSATPRRRMP
jgi:hypothetical protein